MITVTELVQLVGADATKAGVVARLANTEAAAVAHVERVTGRYFGPLQEVTEIIPGYRCWASARPRCAGDRLYLTDLPAEIPDDYDEPEVVVTVEYGPAGALELTSLPDFVLRREGTEAWLERTDGGRWDRAHEYHVTYVRGYAPGAEPEEIRDYVTQYVTQRWRGIGREGVISETIGGYSYRLADGDSGRDRDGVLAHWRRPVAV